MGKIKPKECQNVEFKSIWKDEYLKWICGFANAQGAVMYFGVDDNHEVVGLNDSKKLLEDIPNHAIGTLLTPCSRLALSTLGGVATRRFVRVLKKQVCRCRR